MAGLDAPNCTFVTTLSCGDVHPSHSNFCACCSVLSHPNPLVGNPAMLPHLSQSISQRAGVSHSWYPPQPAIQLLKLYLYRYKYTTNTIQMHNKYNTNTIWIQHQLVSTTASYTCLNYTSTDTLHAMSHCTLYNCEVARIMEKPECSVLIQVLVSPGIEEHKALLQPQ